MKNEYNWDVGPIIPHYTGALSIFGSGWIIGQILWDRKRSLRRPYHRIMLALSVFDFLSSVSFFVGTWASPNADHGGTIATCEASGFFIQLGAVSIPLYNGTLSVFFLLMIKYGWREEKIYKRFERVAHLLITPTALLLAVIPLPLDLYNPFYFYCFPTYSAGGDSGFFGTGEERGTHKGAAAYLYIFYLVVCVCTVVVTGAMVLILLHVKKTSDRNRRYQFERSNSSASNVSAQSSSSVGQRRNRNDKRYNAVKRMAILYTIPFYITWVLPATFMFIGLRYFSGKIRISWSLQASYVSYIFVCTALPIQGFVNWIIYMIPTFSDLYEKSRTSLSVLVCSARDKFWCSREKDHSTDDSGGTNTNKCHDACTSETGQGGITEGEERSDLMSALQDSSQSVAFSADGRDLEFGKCALDMNDVKDLKAESFYQRNDDLLCIETQTKL